jgi:hypothetical protein
MRSLGPATDQDRHQTTMLDSVDNFPGHLIHNVCSIGAVYSTWWHAMDMTNSGLTLCRSCSTICPFLRRKLTNEDLQPTRLQPSLFQETYGWARPVT